MAFLEGELKDRVYALTAGVPGGKGLRWEGKDGDGLEIEFTVTRSRKRSANKCEIKIHNLSNTSIGVLESPGCGVSLLAGYKSNVAVIFTGQIAKGGVSTERVGAGIVTTIEAGDGEFALASVSAGISLDEGATYQAAIDQCIQDMGIGRGNIDLHATAMQRVFAGGFCDVGPTRSILTRLLADLGIAWSIQDGALQALAPGQPNADRAVLLASDSGMVDTPKKIKNGCEAKSLLQPRLKPGTTVVVQANEFSGTYTVSEVTHSGSYRGTEWYTDIKTRDRDTRPPAERVPPPAPAADTTGFAGGNGTWGLL